MRVLFAAALLAGCASISLPSRGGPRQALEEALRSYYDYPALRLHESVESTVEGDGWRVERLRLTSGETRPIEIDWYKPQRAGKLPAILISPILAGNDLYVREFARYFAARGMHAVIVYRPKEIFSPQRPLADIERHLRESILQLRQTLDWLETMESVDSERIGSFSISMGAILGVTLAAVEPRIKASVLGLPAGNLAQIIMTSQDKAIRKRRINYLQERHLSEEEALKQLEEAIFSEPMRFAPSMDPSRVLVIAGIFDRVLGIQRSLALWRAMGRPRLILLPTGHYSAYLATGYLKVATYSFLKRSLRSN
jgi:hypothetical protein